MLFVRKIKEVKSLDEVKEIMNKVEELRQKLYDLIDKTDGLKDEEVMKVSKKLDDILNEYYILLKKRGKDI